MPQGIGYSSGPSPRKARTMLRDKVVRGKPLTPKQRGFFGARASGQPMRRVRERVRRRQ